MCKYTSIVTPVNDDDIPNVAYVNQIASGLKPTYLCNCATTGNIPLTGNSNLEVDGYTVLNDDRVLVKSQNATTTNENTDNGYNGIYVYDKSTGVLTRASDCEPGDDLTNQYTFIQNGTLNGQKLFFQINKVTSFNPPPSGTDTLQYELFSSLNYAVGQGLELIGNSPTTLQVESSLNFLTGVTLNRNAEYTGHLLFNTNYNGDESSTDIYCQNTCLIFDNNSNTTNTTNNQNSFLFACNNKSDSENKQTTPLSFNSSFFSVDLSNNDGGSPVRYEAFNTSSSTGHIFTGNCYIDGSGGTHYPHLTIKQKSNNNNRIEYYTNLDSATNYNGITNAGDNAMIFYKPLSIAHQGDGITSGIRIDISNVRLQASTLNYYDLSLSTGHNFYGNSTNIFGDTTSLNTTITNFNSTNNYFYNNITMNSTFKENRQITTSYLNMNDITNGTNKATQCFQSGGQLLFDNNSNTNSNIPADNYSNSFGFYCNNIGDDNKQTTPLSFNSSVFSVDVSNNAGGSLVRYQACNNTYYNTYYGLPIGHNFTGNCYFNNNIQLNTSNSYIQFPDATKQYTAAYSNLISGVSAEQDRSIDGSNSFNNIYSNLNSSYRYHMSGRVYITYNGGGGDNGGSITYSMEFRSGTGGTYQILMSNSNSVINYKLLYMNVPYSFITTGYTDLDIYVGTQNVDGTWSKVGIINNMCVRI